MLVGCSLLIFVFFIFFDFLAQGDNILNQSYILISLNLNLILFAADKSIIFRLFNIIVLLNLWFRWRVRTRFWFFCGNSFIGLFGFKEVVVLGCKHVLPFMHVPGIHRQVRLELGSQSRLFRRWLNLVLELADELVRKQDVSLCSVETHR